MAQIPFYDYKNSSSVSDITCYTAQNESSLKVERVFFVKFGSRDCDVNGYMAIMNGRARMTPLVQVDVYQKAVQMTEQRDSFSYIASQNVDYLFKRYR